ncbi:aldolase/citrate lyase family protein [Vibrio natriegens]|uniref:aldolase/citrate lyase family protein n=1 Tax=Vibrio natriegens TaxID=691 RepID=UPI001FBA68D4|nr:aldolase/citrate lyase family protein [Vibrio natriegens]
MNELSLMCITNNYKLAHVADKIGVDYIFVDLEILGKEQRQGHLDTVISRHTLNDVKIIREAVSESKLLVRVNPINEKSHQEIENVINLGADVIMLPYFKSKEEVEKAIHFIDGRVKLFLLLETMDAVNDIDRILELGSKIDAIHIGLNDLHLSYKLSFMFEPFVNGIIDKLICKFKNSNVKFGIGGVAELGKGDIPAEFVLNEHFKLGSEMCILSRSFSRQEDYDDEDDFLMSYSKKVADVRYYWNNINNNDVKKNSDIFKKMILDKVNNK